jgi:predicted transcriptional regulator
MNTTMNLEKGDAAIEKGEFITNDQLKQEIKKWQ